jgi:hypothetical protein
VTGDATDIAGRIRNLLPPWFADTNPVLNAFVAGAAAALAFVYWLYAYAVLQCRILTATGIWLDLIAADFFGPLITRAPNQSDAGFRAVILANLFRERATRRGIISVITALTGYAPAVFEPTCPTDTGVYGGPYLGYGVAGGYGSLLLPAQAFVTVYRPTQPGIASVAGYGTPAGGYGVASHAEYASISLINALASDAAIYATIAAAKTAGTIMWTAITNNAATAQLVTEAGLILDAESGQGLII